MKRKKSSPSGWKRNTPNARREILIPGGEVLHCYDGDGRSSKDLGDRRIETISIEDLSRKCDAQPHKIFIGERVTVFRFDDAEVFQITHPDASVSYAIIRR